ncbi:MAG: UrcA family protein [Phenylobacterium sp.]|nr:MAG: UrcA family protein [Phenylobacterium sp.]
MAVGTAFCVCGLLGPYRTALPHPRGPEIKETTTMRNLALATLTAAALCAGAPALAQGLDELTVTGHGPRAMSLSDTVSYADLDLTLRSDRDRLLRRVNDTAGRLCDQLNQDPASNHNIGKSCKDVAVRDAIGQVRQAFADAGSNPAYVNTYGEPTSATVPETPN